jgi:hypothetical protein
MSRLERPQTTSNNPAAKFLQWKSEEKAFSYYNKETHENVKVELPLKFLFLEHYHTVKGWHDATTKGIVSNEVYALGKEELTVRTFGGLELGKGLYKDIKDKVKLSGGVYHRSVYVMLEDGSIANLQLKGAVVGGLKKENAVNKKDVDGYSEFYNQNNRLMDNQWIVVASFEDAKKGATKYSIPVFAMGETISDADDKNAMECAKTLQSYINTYTGAKQVENIDVHAHEEVLQESDGLDF